MTKLSDAQVQALVLTAEENYAHARDHENLRAQVTSMLVAAGFVLIGLSLDKSVTGPKLQFAAVLSVVLSIVNVILVVIHGNRFDLHVQRARNAKARLLLVKSEEPESKPDDAGPAEKKSKGVEKKGSLSFWWTFVACLPGIGGLFLLLIDTLAANCGT